MSVTAVLPPPRAVSMSLHRSPWSHWREHFERNRRRPLPRTEEAVGLPPAIARALARSLARFQIARLRALVREGAR